MPTQRTIYSTLEHVERRLADEGVRPPAVVVIGDVVTIAAELAELGRALGGGDHDGLSAAPSPVPPLAADLIKRT
jgi:uroporphyrin-III C-methyltransferase/precorrin-2 dehydrogenase/sirohydrochlorin ferrochelatase